MSLPEVVLQLLRPAEWMVPSTMLSVWLAQQKGRSVREGAVLGLLLGPFGVLIEALLPGPEEPGPDFDVEGLDPEELHDLAERAHYRAIMGDAIEADRQRHRQAAREAAAALVSAVLAGWRRLPAWAVPIFDGLAIGGVITIAAWLFFLRGPTTPTGRAQATPEARRAAVEGGPVVSSAWRDRSPR